MFNNIYTEWRLNVFENKSKLLYDQDICKAEMLYNVCEMWMSLGRIAQPWHVRYHFQQDNLVHLLWIQSTTCNNVFVFLLLLCCRDDYCTMFWVRSVHVADAGYGGGWWYGGGNVSYAPNAVSVSARSNWYIFCLQWFFILKQYYICKHTFSHFGEVYFLNGLNMNYLRVRPQYARRLIYCTKTTTNNSLKNYN